MTKQSLENAISELNGKLFEDTLTERYEKMNELRTNAVNKSLARTYKRRIVFISAAALTCTLLALSLIFAFGVPGNNDGDGVRIYTSETAASGQYIFYADEKYFLLASDSDNVIEKNLIYTDINEKHLINDKKEDALFYAVIDCSTSYLWKFYQASGYVEKYGYQTCLDLEEKIMKGLFNEIGIDIIEYGNHFYIGYLSGNDINNINSLKQFPEDMKIRLLPKGYTLKDILDGLEKK